MQNNQEKEQAKESPSNARAKSEHDRAGGRRSQNREVPGHAWRGEGRRATVAWTNGNAESSEA